MSHVQTHNNKSKLLTGASVSSREAGSPFASNSSSHCLSTCTLTLAGFTLTMPLFVHWITREREKTCSTQLKCVLFNIKINFNKYFESLSFQWLNIPDAVNEQFRLHVYHKYLHKVFRVILIERAFWNCFRSKWMACMPLNCFATLSLLAYN